MLKGERKRLLEGLRFKFVHLDQKYFKMFSQKKNERESGIRNYLSIFFLIRRRVLET